MSLFRNSLVLLASMLCLIITSVASAKPFLLYSQATAVQLVTAKAVGTNPSGSVTVQLVPTGSISNTVTPVRIIARTDEELPKKVFAGQEGKAEGQSDAKAKAEEEATRTAHLQKIQQLTFDRRPSTILRAWAALGENPTTSSTYNPANGPKADGNPSEVDLFEAKIKDLQKAVTLGQWEIVKSNLGSLPEAEGKACYTRLLETLSMPSMPGQAMMMRPGMPAMPMNPQWMEQNSISNSDVIGLAQAAPHGRDEEILSSLGRLLSTAKNQGQNLGDFSDRARAATTEQPGNASLPTRDIAKILNAAGQPSRMAEFLPDDAKAEADGDAEALNLLAVHYLALHAEKKRTEPLEKAWGVVQASLANTSLSGKAKDESLRLAVELAPQIREELGTTWLDQSFGQRPERGKEILAVIGTATSQGLQTHPRDTSFRKKSLELQKTAVEALLKASPERAGEWAETLELLARGWLAEAEFSQMFDSSTSLGPRMQRDPFGNVFFSTDNQQMMMMQQQQNMPLAIPVGELLPQRPGPEWLTRLSPSLKPQFDEVLAKLFLKVSEEEQAFPCIERLAATNPEQAKTLAEEFLRIWTENHDPNAARNRTNPYMFMFGFERRAEGIPLTRSKQERNLKELTEWVHRLRGLPIGNLDESLLTRAFTTCHSSSEVYKIDAIESVFGTFDSLKPETIAALIQQMRGNLAGVWRMPSEQEKNKTNRREKDIRAEVLRGYQLARDVINRGLEKFPDAWSLVLAKASILHDENNYQQEIEPGPNFTRNRQAAFDEFARAAKLYAAKVPELAQEEESIDPFQIWFYASLGACDLAMVQEKQLANRNQPERIKAVLGSLKGDAAERHRERFANGLFTRMSAANPAVKYRYLENGFAIVGDHPHALEAKKVFDYYKDIVTEIKLSTTIDGTDVVGHESPFGVFVNLRHTKDIERESGGFSRYLQNQNTGSTMFFYNYGRPLENYRDKFEQAARAALQEQFDVLSITFQVETVNSRASEPYGWRVTPYAYLLLKARSPKVDKIPPLRLDLDFLDTSGYVVLPIESPVLPIDARPTDPPARPYRDLKITETLDERQADEGKFELEIKATSLGLVPSLPGLLKLPPQGFEVASIEDKGVSVSRFDPESAETAIVSERQWMVSLRADQNAEKPIDSFQFPAADQTSASTTFQRYVDADLEEVKQEVALTKSPVQTNYSWLWWSLGGIALAGTGLAVAWNARPRRKAPIKDRFPVPENLTPFTVLGLLRSIDQNNGLSPVSKGELSTTINRIERHYFLTPEPGEMNLRDIAETWSRKAR